MTLIANTAEGGSDGTAVTTGNSGGASGTAWAGVTIGTGTINFETSQFFKGSLSYEFAPGSASSCYVHWLPTAANTAVFRGYVRLSGLPSSGQYLINVRTTGGGTSLMGLGVNAGTGTIFIQDTTSTTIFTSTGGLSTNTWYRIEFSLSNGNTATGAMELKVFTGDDTTEIANLSTSLSARNFGTATQGQVRIGRPTALGTIAALYWDDLGWSDGTLTLLGPSAANLPPVADAGPDLDPLFNTLVSLVGTASSDPDGTISTYAWTQLSGAAVTLSGAATATATFTPATPGVRVFQLEVTDNLGATDTDTCTVYVYSTVVRPDSTPTPGLWTETGGAGSIHAALADESDATFTSSPNDPNNSSVVIGLPPMAPGSVTFPIRVDMSAASPAATLLVELLDGTNSDAVVGSEQFNLTTSIVNEVFDLSSAENAAWTNRRIPKIRITADV
jgi:hypothetical protein